MLPNLTLEPTRYGGHRLAAPDVGGVMRSEVKRSLSSRGDSVRHSL